MVTLLALQLALTLSVPDPDLTPGVVRPLTVTQVCTTRWGTDRRRVTVAMKQQVAAAYGLPWRQRATVEFDHLVPRSLAGADDVLNLWPQAWLEARQKDRLEVTLGRLVCAGRVPLAVAQEAFRDDWRIAYARFVQGRKGDR